MSLGLVVASLSLFSAFQASYALPAEVVTRQDDLTASANSNAARCCAALSKALPNLVSMPGSSNFISQQEYYIQQQKDLTPSCRVAPTTAAEVSQIVKLAVANSCKFAVRSGGHGNNKGESNIGQEGFTIHLREMNKFSISADRETVSTGAGALWVDLYAFLTPYKKVALGGRMPTVGTGGFLGGGGISFFSNTYGFGSTSVKNYEVVLSDGSIVNANIKERPDLYWALKMGSTNFGIITRFDLQTLPIGEFWGGHIGFAGLQTFKLHLQWMKDFVGFLSKDTKGATGFGVGSVGDGTYNIWSLNTYSEPVEFPSPLFDGLKAIQAAYPGDNHMRINNLVNISHDVLDANPVGMRTRLIPLAAYKPDVQFSLDVHAKGRELFKELEKRPGVAWNYDYQPISKELITASQQNGGNPSGLKAETLFMVSGLFLWENASDDADIIAASDKLLAWARKTASDRGLLSPFIYLDYADAKQDVYTSFGAENVKKLKAIKSKYDPKLNFDKVWKGGWKL